MGAMVEKVRTFSKKILSSKKGKDIVDSLENDEAHWGLVSEQSSANRMPDAPMIPTSSHKSTPTAPEAPPSPKGGPEIQTSGDYEGLSMRELNLAMRDDAHRQEKLLDVCAEIISSTVKRNDARERVTVELPSFEGNAVKMSADYYVRRVMKYGGCSPCCLVVGCIYLQRLKAKYRSVRLGSRTFVRLFAVAVMSASKVFDDHYLSNKQWADIAGVTLQEMNQLELEFLFRLQFDLCVDRATYNAYVANMLGAEQPAPAPVTFEATPEPLVITEDQDLSMKKLPSACDVTMIATSFAIPA
eukprot:1754967-Rhodomonas_salina.1